MVRQFLIAMSAVFPLAINTIAGVQGIDSNYYNAARSMGASRKDIVCDIVVPGAMPNILTGCRLAMGAGGCLLSLQNLLLPVLALGF